MNMEKEDQKIPLKNKMLKEIFNELEEKAYDLDFHGYHYKEANQIIRRYFEILIGESGRNSMK